MTARISNLTHISQYTKQRALTSFSWLLFFANQFAFPVPHTAAQEPPPVLTTNADQNFARERTGREISIDITPPAGTGADGKPYPIPGDIASQALALPIRPEFREFPLTEKQPLGDWNFRYQPLLFEEVNAERYGDVCPGLQPAVSAAKFYAHTMLLPYSTIRTAARQPRYFPHVDRPGYGGIRETVR